MKRNISLLSLFLVGLLCAADDAPDDLSDEFLIAKRFCVEDFASWLKTNAPDLPAVKQGASAPKKDVWVFPEAFQPKKGGPWKVRPFPKAGMTLSLPGGHDCTSIRVKVRIPEAGYYRPWVRYFHPVNRAASFQLRLLPGEYADFQGWRISTKDTFLEYVFDRSEHNRKSLPLPIRAELPTGFLWEDAPFVYLPAGDICVEFAGFIHRSPVKYAVRNISVLLLTRADGVPSEAQIPVSLRSSKIVETPSPENGALPQEVLRNPSPELAAQWRAWKRDFLGRLAVIPQDGVMPKEGTPEERVRALEMKRAASMVYFEPEVNAVGTPAQIDALRKSRSYGTADQIAELAAVRTMASLPPSKGPFVSIEAEDVKIEKGEWEAVDGFAASGGRFLRAGYGAYESVGTKPFTVPAGGIRRLWCRYSNLMHHSSKFYVAVARPDGSEVCRAFFGENKKVNGMLWESAPCELPPGEYVLTIGKNEGVATFRRVDRVVLSGDPDWIAAGRGVLPGDVYRTPDSRLFWHFAKDVWAGFVPGLLPRPEDVNPARKTVDAMRGETVTLLLHVSNPGKETVTISPEFPDGTLRLCAYMLSLKFSWQPVLLLRREKIVVPAGESAALFLTIPVKDRADGEYLLPVNLGFAKTEIALRVKGDLRTAPVPVVFTWSNPFPRTSAWEMFRDIGINMIAGAYPSKEEMTRYGIRLLMTGGRNLASEKDSEPPRGAVIVEKRLAELASAGITVDDICWELGDEPGIDAADAWCKAAEKLHSVNPAIRIFCNPGERVKGEKQDAAVARMLPYVGFFCPYVNQFGHPEGTEYDKAFRAAGSIKMIYSTPCFEEKRPDSTYDMLDIARTAMYRHRDGFGFFCLQASYPYSNSLWDDVNAMLPDQSVSIYPGADGKTLSTRNLEALREGIQRWRKYQQTQKTTK